MSAWHFDIVDESMGIAHENYSCLNSTTVGSAATLILWGRSEARDMRMAFQKFHR